MNTNNMKKIILSVLLILWIGCKSIPVTNEALTENISGDIEITDKITEKCFDKNSLEYDILKNTNKKIKLTIESLTKENKILTRKLEECNEKLLKESKDSGVGSFVKYLVYVGGMIAGLYFVNKLVRFWKP